MGVNHLGHFAFTLQLLPLLENAAAETGSARIVNVASDGHLHGRIDFDNFFLERGYRGFKAYAASRLATVFFTQELAERLADTATGRESDDQQTATITANCLHPGHVATNIWSIWKEGSPMNRLLGWVMKRFLISPEEGALTSLYLAGSDEVADVTGKYFDECRQGETNPLCADRTLQKGLWEVSEELTGISFG
jgi:NAD(P)-dependent dehydrogenase (short-subunit alcohol dehydrogenase family)